MEKIKNEIESILKKARERNEFSSSRLLDTCYLTDYAPSGSIWTEALQKAISEHEVVYIPKKDTPYLIDNSIIVPSNRKIIAEKDAVIKLLIECRVLLMRNEDTCDGTYAPITKKRSENITIDGGIWEESCPHRMGYGLSGKYDEDRTFFGVSTCMLFENINNLTLRNMTFRNCGAFALQIGECTDAIIENIIFESCYADGVHVNGNVENIHVKNIKGEVGDDLVAFNMFDWQNSSINFGPAKNVICEDLVLSESSHYKALRIEPGVYTFKDGKKVDCSLENAIFRRINGIKTFKLYCQTPPHSPSLPPEPADVGSGDNIFFEDIKIDLTEPIDKLDGYVTNDEIKGSFAGFELGLNAKSIYLKNIDITLYREKFPFSYLLCIGPKSARGENGIEFFDPYFSSSVDNLYLESIKVNGEKPRDISPYIREITFDSLYEELESTASGKIWNIIYR